MNHNEGSVGVTRVTKNVLEVHDIALGDIEVVPDAHRGVDVHRQVKAGAFFKEIAENKVLKAEVVFPSRHSLLAVLGIERRSLFAAGVPEVHGAEVGDLEFHGYAAFFRLSSKV
jgi:hypothetical protein